jgi:hypothetical protein
MQLCPQYVPVEMLCFFISIRGHGHQLDSHKSDFPPTSALSAMTGTLAGQKYRVEILRPLVVPHFDGHP